MVTSTLQLWVLAATQDVWRPRSEHGRDNRAKKLQTLCNYIGLKTQTLFPSLYSYFKNTTQLILFILNTGRCFAVRCSPWGAHVEINATEELYTKSHTWVRLHTKSHTNLTAPYESVPSLSFSATWLPKFFNEISTEKGENNIVKATAIYY